MKKILTSIAILIFANGFGQTIDIGPNEYAFRYTLDNDFGLFFNQTDGRYEFLNASANPVIGFSANTGNFTTNLGFAEGSDLLIGNNRYAFRAASNPNFGLFFNAASTEYQFLDNSASPIFAINANTGRYSTDIAFEAGSSVLVEPNAFGLKLDEGINAGLFFGATEFQFTTDLGIALMRINRNSGDTELSGGLRVGSSSSALEGNIRWSGADFEGYDGFNWVSLTSSGSSSGGGSLQDAYDEGNTILADNGSVSIEGTDGLNISGTFNSGEVPNFGIEEASRFYFYPSRASIRAGRVDGGKWDNSNVGNHSVAFGDNTTASGPWSVAVGNENEAVGPGTFTFGSNNTAGIAASYSFVGGSSSDTDKEYGFAHGANVSSEGISAIGFGRSIVASGDYSFSSGQDNESTQDYAVSFGQDVISSGQYSFSAGEGNISSAAHSVSFGETCSAEGINSFTAGKDNTATEASSTSFGRNSDATGTFSLAVGNDADASASNAVALGSGVDAIGVCSVAMGFRTDSEGYGSFATGTNSVAAADRSVAMCEFTRAEGIGSSAFGLRTIANAPYETTIGAYNETYVPSSTTGIDENDRVFVIGNGTGNLARSNAMVVLKNGNVGIGTSTPDTKLTISGVPSQTVGLNLEGGSNYLGFDGWEIGKASGEPAPVINGDIVIRNFGVPRFNFWNGYFAPSTDAVANLGQFNQRWNIIYAGNGTINTSDAREKKNIKRLDYGLETLMELNPVSYEWKKDEMNVGTKIGFIAQELLEVVPEVVVTEKRVENRETGEITFEEAERMGVFYDDLIPVLTKAIQEQQGQIEEVVEENAELKRENEDLRSDVKDLLESMQRFEQDLQTCCFSSQTEVNEIGTNSGEQAAELGQNIPNPFSESTIIRYYLPNGTANAIIRLTDMEGSPVEDIRLGDQKGANQVEFQTQGLASGTYLYSLFVDGKFVDTKKMMIAR